jgi:uncharacterized protein (UPF0261 family)
MRKPTIVCAGMCNTKGTEIRYLAEQVAERGGVPVIMDLSLGAAVDWADVGLEEVLASTGTRMADVFAAPRATAIDLVGRAGAVKILELHASGRCDGIISWAGSVGTTTATRVMRALPFGLPKIMLTDMASSDVSMWLGNKDIYIVNPTAEQGINIVTRKAVANAAAAVVAMALVPDVPRGSKPLVAITSYGTTTPTVMRCAEFMASRGWDTSIFHSVGVGATMEDLIRSGLITAIIDITPGELMNNVFGSVYGNPKTWEGERLTAAGDMGIPQIVVPGGLDQGAMGPLHTVPPMYLDDVRTERRSSYQGSGLPYQHNASVTILLPSLEEVEQVSLEMVRKLNDTRGPTAFIIPMRGWSAYDQSQELATLERGWASGNGDGPTWLSDPSHPTWSKRATLMLSVVRQHLDRNNPNLDLLACDMHILDPELADLLNRCMGDMLDHTWRKGMYRDVAKVIPPTGTIGPVS